MGQGVRIPVELDQGGERRLHAQLEVSGTLYAGHGNGRASRAEDAPVIDWQSPARFRWQVVLDSHVLPPAEFRSLTRNKRAITRWNDRWVCIDPADLATLATRAVRAGLVSALKTELPEIERLYLDELMQTSDAVEGLRAFLEKREPRWRHA